MMNYDRLKEAAVCVILLLSLVGCGMPGWNRVIAVCIATDDPEKPQCFNDFDEAVAFQRSMFDDAMAQIEPLDQPIAQTAVIVWPTKNQFELALKGREYRSERDFRNVVTIQEDRFVFIEQLIRQRNVFAEATTVRNASAESIEIPAESFAVWLKFEEVFHMRAPRKVDFVPVGQDVPAGAGYPDAARKYLGVIERFVLDHRPAT